VWSARHGELVGEDEYGNRYYRTKEGRIDPTLGFERRWVIYKGLAEGLDHRAGLAWLDASHRRHAADHRESQAAAVVETSSVQSHRHPRCLPPDRFDARPESAAQSDRRLQAMDAGTVMGP